MCYIMDEYFYGYIRRVVTQILNHGYIRRVVTHILKTVQERRETQLQSFRYKIIHGIIAGNKKLFDM